MAETSPEVRDMLFRKIRADPASYYQAPDDVVADNRFGTAEKIDILRQWSEDLRKLAPEDSEAQRPRVERALAALGGDPAPRTR